MAAHAHQAAHQVDHQVGVFLLERAQREQPSHGLVFGALAHHAGIEHDDIRLVGLCVGLVAEVLQGRGHALRIGHVHLAAFSPNVIFHVRYYNRLKGWI